MTRSPQLEGVFLSWLLAQPIGADLAAAADIEISRLGRWQVAIKSAMFRLQSRKTRTNETA
jgi:hypothetical protein